MKKLFKHTFLWVFFAFNAEQNYSQENFSVSGTIKDVRSNERLMGVNILLKGESMGAVSNEYGYYYLSLPPGLHELEVSYLGYSTQVVKIDLQENLNQDFLLLSSEESLDEVMIYQNINSLSLSKPEISLVKLNSETIKKIPAVFGEPDVLKAILQLPGVSNSEGAAGFNVRGGSADQNLVLLDEATVFNTSHLFGFFSVFNNDAIKDVRLYKGGIPSKYGGRVASVLDIYQKDGNSQEFNIIGGVSPISSRLLLEGPIIKDKSSFLIGGRASYAHLFLKASGNENSAYFYDVNMKLTHQLNKNNRLLVSGYLGKDHFSIDEAFGSNYGNSVLNLRWNHIFTDKLFSNLSLIYSDYDFGLTINPSALELTSGIANLNLKYDFNYFLNENVKLNYGVNNTIYQFNPGEISPTSEDSGINYLKIDDKMAAEFAIYLETEHRFSENFQINYGIRFSNFLRFGEETVNIYENDNPVVFNEDLQIYEKAIPRGTHTYGKSDIHSAYNNWEPRLSMAYNWDNQSIKFGYNRMSQYLHLLSNTLSPTPLDIWTPSDQYVKPQILDQVALGYFKNFQGGKYSLEVETFAKKVQNRINYIDGANLIGNMAIEEVLLNGEEKAYGLEFLLRKNRGSFTGWAAYTLSKAQQRTPGRTPNEPGINNGNWYNANNDRTHNLSITTNYEISRKWSVAANFNFQTGRATTYPNGYYEYLDVYVPSFGDRNAGRLPDYHRLDIAATYLPKPGKTKGYQNEWTFGIYNVYNRMNANSVSFNQNRETGNNEAVQLSIFGLIPSVTYNFKF